jgi:hypothetical protein
MIFPFFYHFLMPVLIACILAGLTSGIPFSFISANHDLVTGLNILSFSFLISGTLVYFSPLFSKNNSTDKEFRLRSATLIAIGIVIELFTVFMFSERNLFGLLSMSLTASAVVTIVWQKWDSFREAHKRMR